jgi:hypothetical protein
VSHEKPSELSGRHVFKFGAITKYTEGVIISTDYCRDRILFGRNGIEYLVLIHNKANIPDDFKVSFDSMANRMSESEPNTTHRNKQSSLVSNDSCERSGDSAACGQEKTESGNCILKTLNNMNKNSADNSEALKGTPSSNVGKKALESKQIHDYSDMQQDKQSNPTDYLDVAGDSSEHLTATENTCLSQTIEQQNKQEHVKQNISPDTKTTTTAEGQDLQYLEVSGDDDDKANEKKINSCQGAAIVKSFFNGSFETQRMVCDKKLNKIPNTDEQGYLKNNSKASMANSVLKQAVNYVSETKTKPYQTIENNEKERNRHEKHNKFTDTLLEVSGADGDGSIRCNERHESKFPTLYVRDVNSVSDDEQLNENVFGRQGDSGSVICLHDTPEEFTFSALSMFSAGECEIKGYDVKTCVSFLLSNGLAVLDILET